MSRLSKVFDQAKEQPQKHDESKKTRNKEFVNLNFKVDTEVRRKIKRYAANHDMSLKEVFEAALDFYMKHHP